MAKKRATWMRVRDAVGEEIRTRVPEGTPFDRVEFRARMIKAENFYHTADPVDFFKSVAHMAIGAATCFANHPVATLAVVRRALDEGGGYNVNFALDPNVDSDEGRIVRLAVQKQFESLSDLLQDIARIL